MKKGLCLAIYLLFSFGCAIQGAKPDFVQTVSSDLYPLEMSRDHYYEEMGLGYSQDQQSLKAVENFRLALLHNPQRASARIALAAEYRKLEMNQLAVSELQEVLKVQPNNIKTLMLLGEVYLSAQIFLKAKEVFKQVVQLDPKNDEAKWFLFYVARLEDDDVNAQKNLNAIFETDSNRVQLILEKALLAKRQHKSVEYATWIQKAYQLDPHHKNVSLEMAAFYEGQADFDSALVVLKHFAEAHDFDFSISQGLVYAAVQCENFDLALSELAQQKRFFPDLVEIDLRKAHVYFLKSDLQLAKEEYIQILDRHPEVEEARFYLSQIFIYLNQPDEAKPLLAEFKASSEFFAEARVWLANQERKSGNTELALQMLDRALMQRPDQFVIYKDYADLLVQKKKYKKAISLLKSGVDFFPRSEELRFLLSMAYLQTGNKEAFQSSLEAALQMNPENAEIYSSLAEFWYQKKSSPKEVEAFARKALAYKTKNRNVKPLLAWALYTQDPSTKLLALFEKFYEENPNQAFFAEVLAKIYEASDIPLKAQEMNLQAQRLQNRSRLQSELVIEAQRQPASFKGR